MKTLNRFTGLIILLAAHVAFYRWFSWRRLAIALTVIAIIVVAALDVSLLLKTMRTEDKAVYAEPLRSMMYASCLRAFDMEACECHEKILAASNQNKIPTETEVDTAVMACGGGL